jgi:aminoglycoside phosphotransferase (APT) family kinase protein
MIYPCYKAVNAKGSCLRAYCLLSVLLHLHLAVCERERIAKICPHQRHVREEMEEHELEARTETDERVGNGVAPTRVASSVMRVPMALLDREQMRGNLEAWLCARLPDIGGLRAEPLRFADAGNSAESIYVDVTYRRAGREEQRTVVVRKQIEGHDLFLDSDIATPYLMMTALERHPSVPAPRVIGLERDRAVLGSPFLAMAKVEGRVPTVRPPYAVAGWLKELAPSQQAELWRNSMDAMAKIHRLDWQDGFGFLDRPERGAVGLEQYVNGINEWYRWAVKGRPHPVIDDAIAYLRAHRPPPSPVSVLWGDSQLTNTMYADDLSVAAVLDWEAASLGPAEADFAWWLMFDDFLTEFHDLPRLPGVPDRITSTAIYESFLGRSVNQIEYYEILVLMRLALIIIRGVDRQIAFGRLPENSRAGTHNPVTVQLAEKLGLPAPEMLPDYAALGAAAQRPGQS